MGINKYHRCYSRSVVIARRAAARRGDPVYQIVIQRLDRGIQNFCPYILDVIPAEAGIHTFSGITMDSCLRRNDISWIATEALRPPRNDVRFLGIDH